MKLQKVVYTTKREKWVDLTIGIILFIGVNLLMGGVQLLLGIANFDLSGSGSLDPGWLVILRWLTPFFTLMVNIGLIVFFGLTRPLIALGMLAVIGFFMALSLLAMVVMVVFCFLSPLLTL